MNDTDTGKWNGPADAADADERADAGVPPRRRPGRLPGNWTVEGFFAGQPESMRLFGRVRSFIESLGPVTVDVMKTQIAFADGTAFAWVWLPQTWIRQRPSDTITLAFSLDHRIESPRIREALEAKPGRWMHHVTIDRNDDFDADVRDWLREAREQARVRALSPRIRTRHEDRPAR